MADQTFHAIIEVIDRATAPLHKIEASIAGMVAPITAVTVALGALAEETGIVTLAEHASLAIEKVGDLGRELGALLGPIALIGGVASAEGLMEVAKKNAEFGEKLLHSSQKTGVDIPVLARLHYVAKIEDVDPDLFDKGIEQLNVRLFKAMHGKDKDLDAMLSRFAGSGWRKQVHSVEDGLGLIADAYNKASNPQTRAAIAATAFGQRMGAGMVPVLIKSREELKAMGDEFERFNGIWTPERAQRAAEAADDWKRLSLAGEGLANTIGSAITPALMEMIHPLTEWIAKNRDLVAAKVDTIVRQIGEALKNVDWSGIGDAIGKVWDMFKGLADTLGAQGTVFLAAAVVFGPLAKSAIEAAWALGVLATDIALVIARTTILAATSVAAFFTDFVVGIKLAIPWISALDLALDANPVGAFVLAASGLAAIGVTIYENWKPIVDLFDRVGRSIGNAIDWVTGGQDWSKYAGPQVSERQMVMGAPQGDWSRLGPWGGPLSPTDRLITATREFGGGGAPGQGAAMPNGKVDVNVKLEGLPRGSSTDSAVFGTGLGLNVGKSFQN